MYLPFLLTVRLGVRVLEVMRAAPQISVYWGSLVERFGVNRWTCVHNLLVFQDGRGQGKVLLVAYMRGGSTFTSELFNQNDNATFFYEPLGGVYGDMYGVGRGFKPLDIHYTHEGAYR